MMEDLSISICVPAFNEENSLREAVEDLQEVMPRHIKKTEIIIVDDGSTDSTRQLAETIANKYQNVKVIHHNNNSGVGACYRSCLAVATCDYITWFPADCENSAKQFIPSLSHLREDSIVVYHHRGMDRRFFLRRFISRSYTRVINFYFGLNLKYYNDLTIAPTPLLRSLPSVSNSSVIWAENLIRVIKSGYKVIELCAPLKERKANRSKTFSIPSMINIMKDLFYIMFRTNMKTGLPRKAGITRK